MKTILISGSDTGIGKTWVVGALAGALAARGDTVQIVKPVESGYTSLEESDAEKARVQSASDRVSAYTILKYEKAIAPVAAAVSQGEELSLEALTLGIRELPPADWRLIEGAGGIAVPVSSKGEDWRDLAKALQVDAIVLVIENRLGTINQSRLVSAYAEETGIPVGIWLNERADLDATVRESNRAGLHDSGIRVVGETKATQVKPCFLDTDWMGSL